MEQRHRQQAHAQAMSIIERYLTSTLSQIEFGKQEGLPYSRFNYLRKEH